MAPVWVAAILFIVLLVVLWVYAVPRLRKGRGEYFKSCGGTCKTSADCASGMTCENNQCCA